MDEARPGLNRAEIIAVVGLFASIGIAAIGGLVNYGSQSARIEVLQSTVVTLNQSVVTLNNTLQDTREEVSALKAQRESTDKALSDIKSTLDTYVRDTRFR